MDLTEIRNHVDILHEIKKELDIDTFDSDELEELCDNIGGDDFIVDLDGCEYRFIRNDAIVDIFADSVQEMIEDCYGVGDLPGIISCHLDWGGIVRDCMVDGYGHHFAGYDGMEHEVENYYIFRTN